MEKIFIRRRPSWFEWSPWSPDDPSPEFPDSAIVTVGYPVTQTAVELALLQDAPGLWQEIQSTPLGLLPIGESTELLLTDARRGWYPRRAYRYEVAG